MPADVRWLATMTGRTAHATRGGISLCGRIRGGLFYGLEEAPKCKACLRKMEVRRGR